MFPLEFFEIASQHACFFRTAICRNTLVRTISTLHLGILQNTCLNDVSKKEWQSWYSKYGKIEICIDFLERESHMYRDKLKKEAEYSLSKILKFPQIFWRENFVE